MKKLLLVFALILVPSLASAQCSGIFGNNTVCGNATGSSTTPRATSITSFPPYSPAPAANTFFAGPTSGPAAAPTFRLIASADFDATLCSTNNSIAIRVGGLWSCQTALPDGTTATTQPLGDNSTKVATTAFVIANGGSGLTQHAVILGGGSGQPIYPIASLGAASQALFSNGTGSDPIFRSIVGSDLPNPSSSTLGGVFSKTAVVGEFLTALNPDGTFSSASLTLTNPFQVGGVNYGKNVTSGANYNVLLSPDGHDAFMAGGVGDATNYSKANGGTQFANNAATTIFGKIDSSGIGVRSTGAAFNLFFTSNEVLTANRQLFVNVGNANRTLTYGGNFTTTGGNLAVTLSGATNVTLPTSGTVVSSASTNAVTNTMAANMANSTIKCRTTTGTGSPEDCTAAQTRGITKQGTTLLAVYTASNSANFSDTTSFTSDFGEYQINFHNVVPVTDDVDFNCQVQSGGSFQSTSYLNQAGGRTTDIDISSAGNISNTAGKGLSGVVWVHNTESTTEYKMLQGRTYHFAPSLGIAANNTAGWWQGGTGVITGIRCQMTSGNISTGEMHIYGLRPAL